MKKRLAVPTFLVLTLSALLAMTGCGRRPDLTFRANEEGRAVDDITSMQRAALAETLTDWFGTPDRPKSPEMADLDQSLLDRAAGPVGYNADGNSRGLYRQHCAACHGLSGDGAGPLATTFDPYPRDFRSSVYKYTSTITGARPSRDDLRDVVRTGLEATGMPGFSQLDDNAIESLCEYLIYLGIRGETEQLLAVVVIDEDEYLPLSRITREATLEDGAGWAVSQWALPLTESDQYVITPDDIPPIGSGPELTASITRGRELYLSEDAQCVSCHGKEGRGDGENIDLLDDWNKPKHGVSDKETARLASDFTLPIQLLRPRDFRQGLFRGGTEDIDLYRRIHAGTKGTPMPAAGTARGVPGVYTDQDIRDVVNYIRSLSD